METVDIVVYGGTVAGVAAAAKAAGNLKGIRDKKIALIIPDPVDHNGNGVCLGGLATVGGQNYFDQRNWSRHGLPDVHPAQGTYAWWSDNGKQQFYGVKNLADTMKQDLAKYGSMISYYYGYDITSVSWGNGKISSVNLKQIKRDASTGVVVWENTTATVKGTVFIDASDSGRLTRLSNFGGTVGRYDFPAHALDASEKSSPGQGRQQVATLMFKVTGIDTSVREIDLSGKSPDGMRDVFVVPTAKEEHKEARGNGGKYAYKNNTTIVNFNNKYGPQGFVLKPFNAAQDGENSAEWWVNMLLLFNVDGRANNRDKGTSIFPADMRSDYKTVDDAWVAGRKMLENPEFLSAMRCFPGVQSAKLVMDSDGKPAVGKILYLRETIHAAQSSSARANGTENSNYGLHAMDCWDAGASSSEKTDKRNYKKRIGLNYYYSDINGYKFEDLKDANGKYIWFDEVGQKIRSDIGVTDETPKNPVYVPYDALATNFVYNLLIPGYAVGASSFAWAEIRVLPNQCVLGDAAGVAAAYAVKNAKDPLNFSQTDIANIQTLLKNSNALLEK